MNNYFFVPFVWFDNSIAKSFALSKVLRIQWFNFSIRLPNQNVRRLDKIETWRKENVCQSSKMKFTCYFVLASEFAAALQILWKYWFWFVHMHCLIYWIWFVLFLHILLLFGYFLCWLLNQLTGRSAMAKKH